jgi:hypothetical protein
MAVLVVNVAAVQAVLSAILCASGVLTNEETPSVVTVPRAVNK